MHFKVKVIDEKRNYYKVEIMSKQTKCHILQYQNILDITKDTIK